MVENYRTAGMAPEQSEDEKSTMPEFSFLPDFESENRRIYGPQYEGFVKKEVLHNILGVDPEKATTLNELEPHILERYLEIVIYRITARLTNVHPVLSSLGESAATHLFYRLIQDIRETINPEDTAVLISSILVKARNSSNMGNGELTPEKIDKVLMPLVLDHFIKEKPGNCHFGYFPLELRDEIMRGEMVGLADIVHGAVRNLESIGDRNRVISVLAQERCLFQMPPEALSFLTRDLFAQLKPKDGEEVSSSDTKSGSAAKAAYTHAVLEDPSGFANALSNEELADDVRLGLLAIHVNSTADIVMLEPNVVFRILVYIAETIEKPNHPSWLINIYIALLGGINDVGMLKEWTEMFRSRYPHAQLLNTQLRIYRDRLSTAENRAISLDDFETVQRKRLEILSELTSATWLPEDLGRFLWEKHQGLLPEQFHGVHPWNISTLTLSDVQKVKMVKDLSNEKVFPKEVADEIILWLVLLGTDNVSASSTTGALSAIERGVPRERLLKLYLLQLLDREQRLLTLDDDIAIPRETITKVEKHRKDQEDLVQTLSETILNVRTGDLRRLICEDEPTGVQADSVDEAQEQLARFNLEQGILKQDKATLVTLIERLHGSINCSELSEFLKGLLTEIKARIKRSSQQSGRADDVIYGEFEAFRLISSMYGDSQ